MQETNKCQTQPFSHSIGSYFLTYSTPLLQLLQLLHRLCELLLETVFCHRAASTRETARRGVRQGAIGFVKWVGRGAGNVKFVWVSKLVVTPLKRLVTMAFVG